MRTFICLLMLQFGAHCVVAQHQTTYKAAVVEYDVRVITDIPSDRVLENVREYQNFIEDAADKDVQIIVFPEDGLTGWDDITEENIEELSTEIPEPDLNISPCMNPNLNYSKALVDLSCLANNNKIYVVVNLIEDRHDPVTNKKIYHNTNVVFDHDGIVIARYRKINLFNEDLFQPGSRTSTFKTNFGVTFGIITCFDILFKNPALDVLSDPAVTDVVYLTAWFSELPFFEALSVQHGYATSNGINLLTAGLDDPSLKNGGSGIFLANGKIGDSYILGARSSKMIIYDVPKISARTPSGACKMSGGTGRAFGIGGGMIPDISNFKTSQEDMTNYTFKSLDLDKHTISEMICSGFSKFCCTFNITVMKDPSVQPNYVYKLAAFYGVRQTSRSKTIGIRNCGLVACLNESDASCGIRHSLPPQGVTFDNILVHGIFNGKGAHDQPATLKYNLKPTDEYTFCKRTIDDDVEVTMTLTNKQSTLLTFGMHGRFYTNDNKPNGIINSASLYCVNIYAVFLVSIVIFLLTD